MNSSIELDDTRTPSGLHELVAALAADLPQTSRPWRSWEVQPILGGANNRVYRVTSNDYDLALKFTINDPRDRAGREYHALQVLRQVGLDIAPIPLLIDRSTYSQPIVAQTWLVGVVDASSPATDTDWSALIDHLAAIHSVTPERISTTLPRAVTTSFTVDEMVQSIRAQIERVPAREQPREVRQLVESVDIRPLPTWQDRPPVLCRCDPNTRNFIRRAIGWASVDWENSGWGDPAYEVADLLSHPTFSNIGDVRRAWVISEYSNRQRDPDLALRIETYYRLSLVWWIARLTRMLYEVPRGLDERLVTRPPSWVEDTQVKRDQYVERATENA